MLALGVQLGHDRAHGGIHRGPVRVPGEPQVGPEPAVQPHVAFAGRALAVADDVRLHLAAQAGQRGEQGPVRLRASAGHQAVAALLAQVGEDVLEPAELVAAEAEPGQVVPLQQDRHAQLAGQPRRRVQRRRLQDQADPPAAGQAGQFRRSRLPAGSRRSRCLRAGFRRSRMPAGFRRGRRARGGVHRPPLWQVRRTRSTNAPQEPSEARTSRSRSSSASVIASSRGSARSAVRKSCPRPMPSIATA